MSKNANFIFILILIEKMKNRLFWRAIIQKQSQYSSVLTHLTMFAKKSTDCLSLLDLSVMPSKLTSGSFFPFYKRKFAQQSYIFFVYSKI